MKHQTVAIFVPHEGCPQQCSFCNQRLISGVQKAPTPRQVEDIIERAATSLKGLAQIAFFGGSFTAVNREYMLSMLRCAQKYLNERLFTGIRISTRPDAINKEILDVLKFYHVTDIELGVQSMSDSVLQANLRGHTAEDSVNAAGLIKEYGFGLGLQMMTGLYMDSADTSLDTAKRIVSLKPDTARVYPALVLRGTMLERLYREGEYIPQTLEEAVRLCADLLELFDDNGIRVIRMGLHDSPGLSDSIAVGPYHPAFRELCESRLMLKKALAEIKEKHIPEGKISILTSPRGISKMSGHKRENLDKMADMGYDAKIIPNKDMGYLQIEVLRRM